MDSYNYLEKAIMATEECIDLNTNNDETLNMLTDILDKLSNTLFNMFKSEDMLTIFCSLICLKITTNVLHGTNLRRIAR